MEQVSVRFNGILIIYCRKKGKEYYFLTKSAIKRMSLAGAQHKLAIVVKDGELFEPAGATPSTHILKPNHPDVEYCHSVLNEWFVMRLAKRLGLDVPDVS